MSLLEQASLVITPNAYKENILYSVIPNTTLGDMDVVRATTATRVNEQGLIEVVPRNLVTYSEQFDNANWTTIDASITPNVALSPSGLMNADRLDLGTLIYSQLNQTVTTSGNNTLSIYIRSLTGSQTIFMYAYNVTDGFLLSTPFVIGTDWTRINYTWNLTTTTTFGIRSEQAIAKSFYIWGAQLDLGSSATEYFPTTTRLNIPRIDYTNGSCPSLLVEGQRTNIILNSQNFTAATWAPVATTITANAGISPDGTNNANKFIPSTLATSHYIAQGFISSLNGSISVYAKADGYNNITLLTSNTNINYNLSTGTIQAVGGVGTGAIQNVGNGWYRCILFKVLTTESLFISCGSNTNAGFFNGSGNGTSGVLIWGAQVEVGAYPTSYIPTVASTVTRNADVISKTGISSLIGQTEGTIFFDGYFNDVQSGVVFLDLEGTLQKVNFQIGGGVLYFYSQGEWSISTPISLNTRYKIAGAYKNNDIAFYVNGVLIGTDTSANITAKSNFYLNSEGGLYNADLDINSVQLYKTRLTNTELAQLTTL